MWWHVVFVLMVSSSYASKENFYDELYEDNLGTPKTNFAVVDEVTSKGRRNFLNDNEFADFVTVDQEEIMRRNLLTNIIASLIHNNENSELSAISRKKRSFVDYDELSENMRLQNKDPQALSSEIRTGTFSSNTYNEDEKRKLFFSQIFSLFDDDNNYTKSRKNNGNTQIHNDDKEHSILFDGHKTIKYEDSKSNPRSSKEFDDPFKSNLEAFMYDEIKSKRPILGEHPNDVTVSHMNRNDFNSNIDVNPPKHKRKFKRRRQAKEKTSLQNNVNENINLRPERQLSNLGNFGNTINEFLELSEYGSNKGIINKKIQPSVSDESLGYDEKSSSVDSLPISTDSSVDYSSTDYENSRTGNSFSSPILNNLQTDVTNTSPDNRELLDETIYTKPSEDILIKFSEKSFSPSNINSSTITDTEDNLTTETNKFTLDRNIKNSVLDEKVLLGTAAKNYLDFNNQITKYDVKNESDRFSEDTEEVGDDEERNLSDIPLQISSNAKNTNFRRDYNTLGNIQSNRPEESSNVKEDTTSHGKEFKLSKVYGQAEVIPITNDVVVNPLSTLIKLNLLIQLPSHDEENRN